MDSNELESSYALSMFRVTTLKLWGYGPEKLEIVEGFLYQLIIAISETFRYSTRKTGTRRPFNKGP